MRNSKKVLLTLLSLVFYSQAGLAQTARITNLSTRAICATQDAVMVDEFILQGTGSGTFLMRGLGPSLSDFGISDPLRDPTVTLRDARGRVLDANDNWMNNPDKNEIIATGLAPTDPRESALIDTLAPGLYTFVEQGLRRGQGVALPEIYDLGNGDVQLSAVGTRAFVSTGSEVLISGFVLTGSQPVRLLIRALGPSMAAAGVTPVLADPFLLLYDINAQLLSSNDNWRATQEAEIIASGLAPADDLEAALIVTLVPGAYTNVVAGINNTTGIAFFQIYSLDLPIRELDPAPRIKNRP